MCSYLSMCTCTYSTMCMGSMGMGAPVAHDVTSHNALKIQHNGDIWVSVELFKAAL